MAGGVEETTYFAAVILRRLVARTVPLVLWCGLKDVEVHGTLARADFEDARRVAATVAVIRGGPDGGEVVVEQDAVALHAELVGAQDVGHVVCFQEFSDDAGAKGVSGTAARDEERNAGDEEGRTGGIWQNPPCLDRGLTIRGPPWDPRGVFLCGI